jgi:multicomponent Na+:H+ antiporter subunit G
MTEWSTVVAGILVGIGVAFDLFGCIGLVRLPDVFTRLQASTKCVTLGTCLILLGVVAASGFTPTSAKALLCAAFIFVTCPTAAHALARGSYRAGIKPSPSKFDAYCADAPERCSETVVNGNGTGGADEDSDGPRIRAENAKA